MSFRGFDICPLFQCHSRHARLRFILSSGGRASGKSYVPEPGAEHPAALPAGQSHGGGSGAAGCQGQCPRQSLSDRLGSRGTPVQRMCPSQTLQVELNRAQEAARRHKQQTAEAEEQLKLVANILVRYLSKS